MLVRCGGYKDDRSIKRGGGNCEKEGMGKKVTESKNPPKGDDAKTTESSETAVTAFCIYLNAGIHSRFKRTTSRYATLHDYTYGEKVSRNHSNILSYQCNTIKTQNSNGILKHAAVDTDSTFSVVLK